MSKYTIKISQDDISACSPRNIFCNVGTMVCWHRRYTLGDEQPDYPAHEYKEDLPDGTLYLPIYMYDHSGITMSTTPFSCSHDSGQVGFIYITSADIDKHFGGMVEDAEKALQAEVEEYNQYLMGNVWAFCIYESCECCGQPKPGGNIESCYGHIGDDIDCIIDSIPSGYVTEEQIQEAWENRI